ncbi:MAG: hypothetical protein ACE5HU_10970, partial [Acidobacteriota bacterium]
HPRGKGVGEHRERGRCGTRLAHTDADPRGGELPEVARQARHAGVLARFLDGTDGIDPGDELRFFASFVKPVYKDYLSVELAFNGMHKEEDHYSGQFTHPVPDPVTGDMAGFATTDRPPFRGGTVLFASPSLIFIPNPWLRLTLSGMFRVNDPDLGPWPGSQLRVGTTVTF